jgi:hypothetical protein
MDLLSHGQILVPRDAKVMGHVTAATSRSKDSPDSTLGIAFDRVVMKDGRELPIHATVQAVGRPLNEVPAPGKDGLGKNPMATPSDTPIWDQEARGTSPRPIGSPNPVHSPGDPARTAPDPAPHAQSEEPASALDPRSQGVVGLKGLSLGPSDQGSIVTSSGHNVHLDSGTQLILRTE